MKRRKLGKVFSRARGKKGKGARCPVCGCRRVAEIVRPSRGMWGVFGFDVVRRECGRCGARL